MSELKENELKLCPFISTVQVLAGAVVGKGKVVPDQIPDMPPDLLGSRLIKGGPLPGDKAYEFGVQAQVIYSPRADNKERPAAEPLSVPCVRDKCQLWSETRQDCKLGLIADQLGAVLQLAKVTV